MNLHRLTKLSVKPHPVKPTSAAKLMPQFSFAWTPLGHFDFSHPLVDAYRVRRAFGEIFCIYIDLYKFYSKFLCQFFLCLFSFYFIFFLFASCIFFPFFFMKEWIIIRDMIYNGNISSNIFIKKENNSNRYICMDNN